MQNCSNFVFVAKSFSVEKEKQQTVEGNPGEWINVSPEISPAEPTISDWIKSDSPDINGKKE
ncbi:MAG: hypothetical protein HY843_04465 [Bdellovibrio sp.]|nr:hypothetical protein [Bdellovibrio sp.]